MEQPADWPWVTPSQLPIDVYEWVNRESEMRTLKRLAGVSTAGAVAQDRGRWRPVIVTGPAGVGKSALARHCAHQVSDDFPDGALYADLRGFAEGPPVATGSVLDRFLRDLGVPAAAIPADLDERSMLLRSRLAGRRVLILLDNASQAGQVRPLLPGDDGSLVIVTSRDRLGGLLLHDGARHLELSTLRQKHAVDLLRQVTRAGGRHDSAAELAELAELCARLPLALRLAGVRAISRPGMRLTELFAELRDESLLWDALSVGDEGVRTVFAGSYRDLSPEAARMFRVLGLHRGTDISLPVAAAAAGVSVRTAHQALDILVGAFLAEPGGPGRYRQHDLMRAYALAQARAVDSGYDRRDTVDRVVAWYVATAHHASEVLLPGRAFALDAPAVAGAKPASFQTPDAAFEWFDTERPNLVANAHSALEAGLPHRAWELAMVLSPIHASYFTFDDWSDLSDLALAAAREIGDPLKLASALDNQGRYRFRRGRLAEAAESHADALAIQEENGDGPGALRSRNALGLVHFARRDLAEAERHFTGVVDDAREAGQARWEGVASVNLGHTLLESGDVSRAMDILAPLPEIFARRRDQLNEGTVHHLLAMGHRLAGDYPAAQLSIDLALRIAEAAKNQGWEANWLIEAARGHLVRGELTAAMRCCQRAASLHRQIGDGGREAVVLDCRGEVEAAMGNLEDASAYHRAAAQAFQGRGDDWAEALARVHLADREESLGRDGASREETSRALALVERFPDAPAVELKDRLRRRLS